MVKQLQSLDITNAPELLRLAQEVQVSRQPRLLRANDEEIAVLMPLRVTAPRVQAVASGRARASGRRFTIESAAGSVQPPTRTEDIDAMIREAKEEHADSPNTATQHGRRCRRS
jgi:hypothetical protein